MAPTATALSHHLAWPTSHSFPCHNFFCIATPCQIFACSAYSSLEGQGLISTQTFHSPHVLYHYMCLHNSMPHCVPCALAPILIFRGLTHSDSSRHFFQYLRTSPSDPVFRFCPIFDQGDYAPPFPHPHTKFQVICSSSSSIIDFRHSDTSDISSDILLDRSQQPNFQLFPNV